MDFMKEKLDLNGSWEYESLAWAALSRKVCGKCIAKISQLHRERRLNLATENPQMLDIQAFAGLV